MFNLNKIVILLIYDISIFKFYKKYIERFM